MAKESSPEEKLLNLIKRRRTRESPPPKDAGRAPLIKKGLLLKEPESPISSLVSGLNNILLLKNIGILNTVLFIMLIAVILYFLIDIFLIPPREPTLLEEKESKKAPEVTENIEVKPYSYYSKDLAAKEVFKAAAREEEKEVKPEVPVEDLMANLALLGIVSGENPQAIIEDKKQKKTFFLREGQSAGGVHLKRIEGDKVTVIYKGEEFDLTM